MFYIVVNVDFFWGSGLDLTVMGRSHAQSPRSSRSPKSSRSPVSRSPEFGPYRGVTEVSGICWNTSWVIWELPKCNWKEEIWLSFRWFPDVSFHVSCFVFLVPLALRGDESTTAELSGWCLTRFHIWHVSTQVDWAGKGSCSIENSKANRVKLSHVHLEY